MKSITICKTIMLTSLISLSSIALAQNGPSTNGNYTNGSSMNGTHPNGPTTNGTHPNGTPSNGTTPNGTTTNGTNMNGTSTTGSTTNGSYTNGMSTDVSHTRVMTATTQTEMTPQAVLQRLKDGNMRFTDGKMKNRDLLVQANATATAQHPVAVVLSCLDSRTAPDIVFDQGIGDIFVARIAGNIQNDDILGSMEFATKLMGAKLIAVIGHTSCGAMRGACQNAKLGHLTALLQKIKPAVQQAATENKTKDCNDNMFIDQIAKDNVLLVIKQIKSRSSVIAKLIQEGKVGIVGGVQDISTGTVTFFDDQMILSKS
jgi:carbonic anhydrase